MVFSARETSSASSDFEVYRLIVNPRAVTRLSNNTTPDIDVSITANGSRLAFQGVFNNKKTVFYRTYSGATFVQTRVVSSLEQVQPSLSSNGTLLALIRLNGTSYQVALYDLIAQTVQVIYSNTSLLEHPSASNGGSKVAWLIHNATNKQVKVKTLSTGAIVNAVTATRIEHPHLKADGRFLTYGFVQSSRVVLVTRDLNTGNAETSSSFSTNINVYGMYWQDATTTQPKDLLITEISSSYFADDSAWIEIYNPTASSINLSSYKLRTLSQLRISPYTYSGPTIFNIPSLVVKPFEYVLVIGQGNEHHVAGPHHVYVLTAPNTIPRWGASGFIELLKNNQTVDFVRFGTDTTAPTTTSAWSGANVPAMPSSSSNYGKPIVRNIHNSDTNRAPDWTQVNFATAGGPNDVPSGALDNDGDGIPDTAEVSGGTYAGLNLYAMGARTGRVDIFIEIDYMNSTDPGVNPQPESLAKVVDVFDAQNIAIHFDVDDKVPFAPGITIPLGNGSIGTLANFYTYKATYMDLPRRQMFHYLLMANSQKEDGTSGSSGLAELNGNDLIVTMGGWGLKRDTPTNTNMLINWQASTIMHELGHNLGLRHGGNVDTNFKSNYFSIMSYMYQLNGLGPVTGNRVGDRYYKQLNIKGVTSCSMINSPCSNTFKMDFSNGTSTAINEFAIDESKGIGRGNAWVDYDNGGTVNTVAIDINFDNVGSTHTDYNDWGNLVLPFQRYFSGNNILSPQNLLEPFDPIKQDAQKWIIEEEPKTEFFEELRTIQNNQ